MAILLKDSKPWGTLVWNTTANLISISTSTTFVGKQSKCSVSPLGLANISRTLSRLSLSTRPTFEVTLNTPQSFGIPTQKIRNYNWKEFKINSCSFWRDASLGTRMRATLTMKLSSKPSILTASRCEELLPMQNSSWNHSTDKSTPKRLFTNSIFMSRNGTREQVKSFKHIRAEPMWENSLSAIVWWAPSTHTVMISTSLIAPPHRFRSWILFGTTLLKIDCDNHAMFIRFFINFFFILFIIVAPFTMLFLIIRFVNFRSFVDLFKTKSITTFDNHLKKKATNQFIVKYLKRR